jgi:hypothetical protein
MPINLVPEWLTKKWATDQTEILSARSIEAAKAQKIAGLPTEWREMAAGYTRDPIDQVAAVSLRACADMLDACLKYGG